MCGRTCGPQTTLRETLGLVRCAFALKAVLKTALRLPPSRSGDWNMSTDELDCIVSLCFVEAHRTAQAVFRDMMAATLAAGEG